MEHIFQSYFINSLNMAFIILLLILLMPVIKKYLSAGCIYRIWIIVLIGLLVPIRPDTNMSLFHINMPQIYDQNIEFNRQVKKEFINEGNENPYNNVKTQNEITTSKEQENKDSLLRSRFSQALSDILSYRNIVLSLVWIITALIIFAVKGIGYYVYRKKLKRLLIPIHMEDFGREFDCCIQELGIKSKRKLSGKEIKIFKCSAINSPISIGIIKPTIILPEEVYSEKDMYFIFKHEIIHILRRDSLIKILRLIVLSLNWYNPFSYVLAGQVEKWCETSCDEQVLMNSSRSDKFCYSRLLLRYADLSKYNLSIINTMGGRNMKKRIKAIIENKKKYSGIIPLVLLLCVVFTTVIVSINPTDTKAYSDDTVEEVEEAVQPDDNLKEANEISQDKSNPDESETLENSIEVVNSEPDNSLATSVTGEEIAEYALQTLGNTYIWGGNDLSTGVDSSGLTQAIYKEFGYSLPRTSSEQADFCKEVSMDSIQPGDLIFYSNDDNEVNHVGIYIGDDKVIHAKNSRDGVVVEDLNYRPALKAGRVL